MTAPEMTSRYIYAGWKVRAVAGPVDVIAVLLVVSMLLNLGDIAAIAWPVGLYAYLVCAEALTGTTLGKRFFRMVVVRQDPAEQLEAFDNGTRLACEEPEADRISWLQALGRNISKTLILLCVAFLVGLVVGGSSLSPELSNVYLLTSIGSIFGCLLSAFLHH